MSTAPSAVGSSPTIDLGELRLPAAGLIAAGILIPLLDHPGGACPLRTWTGIPCPLCGMTTSVTSTLQGDLSTALAASPAGVAVVVVALYALLSRRPRRVPVPMPAVIAVLIAMWVFQLFRFSIL